MKQLLRLSLALSAIYLISVSATPKHTSSAPEPGSPVSKASYGFYVQNGTAWNGTVTGYGAIYTPSGAPFGTSGVYFLQSINPAISYITVTITCNAPGSHTYGLTGGVSPTPTPVTTSSGSVTWTGVSVVAGDIDAYIH